MRNTPNIFLAFDFGTKHIGTAVGNRITLSATPLVTITNRDTPDWNSTDSLIKKWKPDALIVGAPLNMDGTRQALTDLADRFAEQLRTRYHIAVIMVDERLSTRDAKQQIFDAGGYKALQKTSVDCIAAKLILEHYLRTL